MKGIPRESEYTLRGLFKSTPTWLIFGMLVAALALVLCSCGAPSTGSGDSASTNNASDATEAESDNGSSENSQTPASDNGDEVTITVSTSSLSFTPLVDDEVTSTYDFLEKVAKAFEEDYTKYKVNIKLDEFDLTTQTPEFFASVGTEAMPNVLLENYMNMETYIHTGYVVPLDDIISDDLRADIDPDVWELSQVDGKTYMMPFYTYENVLAYNRDIFRQAGLDKYIGEGYEIQNWTLDEWDEILAALAQAEGDYFPMMGYAGGVTGDTHTMVLLRSRGSQFFDENGNFNLNTPEGIAALQWLKDNYDRGYYPPGAENLTIEQNGNLFYDHRLGLYLYNIVFTEKTPVEEFGYVNFPSEDGNGYTTSFMTGFEVFDTGNEKELEVSKAFVQYVMETEEWLDYSAGLLPVSNKVIEKYGDQMPVAQMFFNNDAELVDFTARNPNWVEVRQAFYPYIHDLFTGKKTPEEVAEQMDAEINAILEKGRAESKLHE